MTLAWTQRACLQLDFAVADLYADQCVSPRIASLLSSHRVVTARSVHHSRAGDHDQLLYAALNKLVLITCDLDFLLLHDAWRLSPIEWLVAPLPVHGGILLTRPASSERIAQQVSDWLLSGQPAENELYEWTGSHWVRY